MTSDRLFLRHAVATLAYRAGKAVRGAPATFADFTVADGSRTPVRIVAHMGDLLDWALYLARGEQSWHDSMPLPWDLEVARLFAALAAFDAYLASEESLGWSAERLFQGPIADALTHTGQLTMLPPRWRTGSRRKLREGNHYRRDGWHLAGGPRL